MLKFLLSTLIVCSNARFVIPENLVGTADLEERSTLLMQLPEPGIFEVTLKDNSASTGYDWVPVVEEKCE